MGKGEDFERQISKKLSLWWTDGERDDVFWRTSQSGGRATQRAKSALDTAYSYGDLTFIDPIGKPLCDLLVIEAKRGYTNTSRKIKAADMEKVCEFLGRHRFTTKQAKSHIQSLFSKAKKGGGIDLLDFVDDPRPVKKLPLYRWIAKAETDRAQAGVPYFWLIGRRDGKQEFILMPRACLHAIDYNANSDTLPANTIIVNGLYFMTSLEPFLDWLDPEWIKNANPKNKIRRFKG